MAKNFLRVAEDSYINLDSIDSFSRWKKKPSKPSKAEGGKGEDLIILRSAKGDYYNVGEFSMPAEYRYLSEWLDARVIELNPNRGADGKFRKEEVTDGA